MGRGIWSGRLAFWLVVSLLASACGGVPPAANSTAVGQASRSPASPSPAGGVGTAAQTPAGIPTTAVATLSVPPATATAPRALATAALPPGQVSRWAQAQGGVQADVFFNPYPPRVGTATTYGVLLRTADGQPLADAAVEVVVTLGMAGMEGEHDESERIVANSQGGGVYAATSSLGSSDQAITGVTVRVRRGGQEWSFVMGQDDLKPR